MQVVVILVLVAVCVVATVVAFKLLSSAARSGGTTNEPAAPSDFGPPAKGIPAGATVMKSKSSFKRIQEPVVYPKGAGSEIQNITDLGNGVVRFRLRVERSWWDGDGAAGAKGGGKAQDRQRAECRLLGGDIYQKKGETWEYGTTFRTNPGFKVYGKGWNDVMQLKTYSGFGGSDMGMPLVKLTIDGSGSDLQLLAYSPAEGGRGKVTARSHSFKPGEWVTAKFRVTTGSNGMLQMSINGDAFQGKSGVAMNGPGGSSSYNMKCGLYRKLHLPQMAGADDYIDHKNTYIVKL